MSFVSYAQNFEDVILWRALRDVGLGFYIDVGANDPEIDSVTRAFYERGWRGVNIEPLTSHWTDLMRERPNDINLQCAAGEFHAELELWEPEIRGWATLSPEVIAKHQSEGCVGKSHPVRVLTLAEICAAHVSGEIHFLKIDVEGSEQAVLAGMDFARFRPWIVVIEATLPDSTIENYRQWEPLLLSQDYRPAYADGLNRFYVATERAALQDKLRYPPNVFDDFVRNDQIQAEARAQQAQHETARAKDEALQAKDEALQAKDEALQAKDEALQAKDEALQAKDEALQAKDEALQAKDEALQAKDEALQANHETEHLREQIRGIHNSTSWQITRPLRGLKRVMTGDFSPLFRIVNATWRFFFRRSAPSQGLVSHAGPPRKTLSPHVERIDRWLQFAAGHPRGSPVRPEPIEERAARGLFEREVITMKRNNPDADRH